MSGLGESQEDNEFVHHPVNIGVAIFLLSWTLCVSYPLFIVSWMKLKQLSSRRYFQQRGVPLIVLQTAIMFCFNCVISPFEIVLDDLKLVTFAPIIAELVEHIMQGALFLALFLVICIRVWLVNYNHKLQLEMADAAWKQQLHAFSVDSASFYAKHKNTLGSMPWMTKVIGTLYILLMASMLLVDFVILPEHHSNISHIVGEVIMSGSYVLSLAFILAVWVKFPKFNDNLFIRHELRASFVFTIAVMIFGTILFFIGWKIESAYNISQFALMLTVDGLCYISILRVVRLNKESAVDLATELADNNDMAEYNKLFTMEYVIERKIGYVEFMKFLVHEFASENLCFATEYCQFRESLNLSEKQKRLLHCNVKMHPAYSHKKSEFQTNALDCHEFIEIVTKLYTKYIAEGTATYEINVSYESRLALASLIDPKYKQFVAQNQLQGDASMLQLPKNNLPKTIEIIIPILEEILLEITGLLQSAFARFRRSAAWSEVCNTLIDEHKNHSRQHRVSHHGLEEEASRTKSSKVDVLMILSRGSNSNRLRVSKAAHHVHAQSTSGSSPNSKLTPTKSTPSSPDPDGQVTFDLQLQPVGSISPELGPRGDGGVEMSLPSTSNTQTLA